MKRVVILVHEKDATFGSNRPGYLIELLMREWQQDGIDIGVARGIDRPPTTDLLIPHMDLTVIPDEYWAFMQECPFLVNARVRDTSKSRTSTNLLARGDDYIGPVIVKTDRNYGGLPEANLAQDVGSRHTNFAKIAANLRRKLTGSVSWRHIDHLEPSQYKIFPSLEEVPSVVFKNRNLVVEKYIPEMDGDDYLLRYYYFFGDSEVCFLLRSKKRIVKFSSSFLVEEIPVHQDLRRIRHQLGFDYGKFDYFVHNGDVVVFDVNKTPGHTAGHAGGRHERLYQDMVRRLARGIGPMLNGSRVN